MRDIIEQLEALYRDATDGYRARRYASAARELRNVLDQYRQEIATAEAQIGDEEKWRSKTG